MHGTVAVQLGIRARCAEQVRRCGLLCFFGRGGQQEFQRKRANGCTLTASLCMVIAMPAFEPALAKPVVFRSWKSIAAYLNRGVRTVQRWHSDLQLPVHQVKAQSRSQVFAYKAELDQWLQKCAHTNSSSGEDRLAPEARPIRTVVARTSKLLFMASRQHDQIASINATVRRMVEREKARAGAVKT